MREAVYYSADFETTPGVMCEDGMYKTEVWSSCFTAIDMTGQGIEKPCIIHTSINQSFWWIIEQLKFTDVVLFYHNLSFDGTFWLDYLTYHNKYMKSDYNEKEERFSERYKMRNWRYSYLISDMGQWYNLVFKAHGHYCYMYDSLKMLPFTLKQIGQSFKTKHQKLEMDYAGHTRAGQEITAQEKAYIENDVLVLKEAIEEFKVHEGHTKTTIGGNCFDEFTKCFASDRGEVCHDSRKYRTSDTWTDYFPCLKDRIITPEEARIGELDTTENLDDFIRRSYHGGWCYVNSAYAEKVQYDGLTADVNSLYPSQMHSDGGRYYPIGKPHFIKGSDFDSIKDKPYNESWYCVKIKCRFKLKTGYLPFIQIKGNKNYRGNEMLKTSDVYDKKTRSYTRYYKGADGKLTDSTVELTLTKTDYILFHEHYDVINEEVMCAYEFKTAIGLFDSYINKYREIKINSKGAKRTIAKLFLNNLYGQLAKSDNSSFKVVTQGKYNDVISYKIVHQNEKEVVYIPIGSAITSYARDFTIRTAQKNYKYFRYADTDSIHCVCKEEELIDVPVHPTNFNHWSIESKWTEGIFSRQKTYIEKCNILDGEVQEEPKYIIKCAGMTKKSKGILEELIKKGQMTLEDFKPGLEVEGKLAKRTVRGGVILYDTTFCIKDNPYKI